MMCNIRSLAPQANGVSHHENAMNFMAVLVFLFSRMKCEILFRHTAMSSKGAVVNN